MTVSIVRAPRQQHAARSATHDSCGYAGSLSPVDAYVILSCVRGMPGGERRSAFIMMIIIIVIPLASRTRVLPEVSSSF